MILNKKRPLIIAEISGNHNGSRKRFLSLIKSAILNGADLIKIQTYEPSDITLKSNLKQFTQKKGLWKNKTLWQLYQKAHTPFKWHKEAFKLAKKFNKKIFSSPFSIRAVDYLEKLNCPIYKIASFEITDFKLIDYIASKKKPIIISTGMSKISEIKKAIKLINKYHENISILHCVSNYPTKIKDLNLSKIKSLKKIFPKYKIGLSDHTNGISSSIIATQYNISYIEKHFNIDKLKTSDSSFSIQPNQLKELKEALTYLFSKKKSHLIQKQNISFRRSIFSKKKILKNELITTNNIDTLRPKIGICASKYFDILNKRAKKDILPNKPIFRSMLF